jgi:hypothetical protein
MKLFDPSYREAIEWGLKRVFDFSPSKINKAIASQVLLNVVKKRNLKTTNYVLFNLSISA